MDKPKRNYRFHTAATPEKMIKELLLICMEANRKKVEKALEDEVAIASEEEYCPYCPDEVRRRT